MYVQLFFHINLSIILIPPTGIPHKEYASITVKHPAGILEFPTAYITHLYEPNQNNVAVALGKGNTLFISTQNSDGAGGYYAVWTVENYLVKRLFVLHDF